MLQLCECVALHLSLRAPSARVDLPSDKGRLLGAYLRWWLGAVKCHL